MKTIHKKQIKDRWDFVDNEGSFVWKNPHSLNQLYLPLCNEAGFMASITPTLNGDSKTGQHTFLLLPVSVEDLHNNRSARNFWVYNEKLGPYSLTGNSARQNAERFTSKDTTDTAVKGEMLAHHLIREDWDNGITSEIINFCPATDNTAEIMWIKIINTGNKPFTFTPTSAIPIFGRSAENIRDHKHATSLIHRQEMTEDGVIVTPVIYHDERGHKPNDTSYYVVGVEGSGKSPIGQFPTVMEFIGEGGSFDWPQAVIKNLAPYEEAPNRRDGMESIGALRFQETTLKPGETKDYIVIMGITTDKQTIHQAIKRYGSSEKVRIAYEENRSFWAERIDSIAFSNGDFNFSNWMRWIALQPMLRKIYGCSFLPHHDYGKGGRGWRDLWQDCLALLLQDPKSAREILISNFGGVRTDGTNATIIAKGLGNFAADRNSISRVWMDHGVWPFYTTKLYIDQTGDFEVLLEKNTYWRDHQIYRAKAKDEKWVPAEGNKVKTRDDRVYEGTLLEHILVQHLTCFFNVGEHGNIKLEDGDWNDQLDMAPEKGETVPFSAFYASNLIALADLLLALQKEKDIEELELSKEILMLTNLSWAKTDITSSEAKQKRLKEYLEAVSKGLSDKKVETKINDLAADLKEKGNWLLEFIRQNEWIKSKTGLGFFNGYYNNDGKRVDGDQEDGVRMNLTAQTFAAMSGAATEEQVKKSFKAAQEILRDPNTGGFRLTTPLGPNTFNFGRGFALIYGEKETGAMFSHMAVMYTNSLYKRKFVREGFEVFSSIYNLCNDTPKAKIYPGLPEYITHEGRGMYHYLTGSASWMLMTMVTEIFGVRGELGNLRIEPKLVKEQFGDDGKAKIHVPFAGKEIDVIFNNPTALDYESYKIKRALVNGVEFKLEGENLKSVLIERDACLKLLTQPHNTIEVFLG